MLRVHVVVDVKLVRVLGVFRRVRVPLAPDLDLELKRVPRCALVVQNLLVWRKNPPVKERQNLATKLLEG